MTETTFSLADLRRDMERLYSEKGYKLIYETFKSRNKEIFKVYCKVFNIDYNSFKKTKKCYALDAVTFDSIFFFAFSL